MWFFTFVFAGELLRHTLGSERKEPLRKKGNRMLGSSPKRILTEAKGTVLGQTHCCSDRSILVMTEGKLGFSELNK